MRVWVLLAAIGTTFGALQRQRLEGSAVQKIIGMLGEMKAKVEADLATETKQMEEYMQFCDDQSTDKVNAIKTATRQIQDLAATIEQSSAIVVEMSDEISTLGTTIAAKEKELAEATSIRKGEHEDFKVTEKELVESVDQLGGAIVEVKKGMSLAQGKGLRMKAALSAKQLKKLVSTLGSIVESARFTGQQKKHLKSFIQASQKDSEDDSDDQEFSLKNRLRQPQAKVVAYESKSGGIMDILEETKDKAEVELSDARKAEMEAAHEFAMVKQSLENEISTMKEKLADCQAQKSSNEEAKGAAEGEKGETEKSKAMDTETLDTLKAECQGKAVEWEERLKSAKGEMGALDKAKEILQSGVKAFIQVSVKRSSRSLHDPFMSLDSEDDDDDDDVRSKVVDKLRKLGRKFNSFSLAQVANRAKSDPMAKIRGLIEEMIAKLLAEQQAEANQKAFCDEEMGKSKKAQEIKTAKLGKLSARIDEGESRKVQLLEEIRNLESELAEIDRSQAEATQLRTKEHEEFLKSQADYQSSEDACAQAVEVLKEYYSGGAFIQIRSSSRRALARAKDDQPDFGGANKDAGGSIIEFLEFAEEDFARLLAEVEAAEDKAQSAFDKLSTENKVAKATKTAEAKAKNSEVKSLTKSITEQSEDKDGLNEELAAVNMYIEKLKPQCESKAMSAGEKIAAKKAEIEGLKEALSILEGKGMFLQTREHQ